ncbi:MAG: DUF4445 domain-containing protein [Oscillospiraceae bacterium]|nr:DUF4445 domain-containing protein [Oscillospiraceae bacterium]
MAKVRIFKNGALLRETEANIGETVYAAVTAAGLYLDAPCAGTGRCGKCLVQLSPDGERVKACRTDITGDTDVYLPEDTEMRIAGVGAAESGHTGPYAAAVDIGTTTVVAHVVDVPTGKVIATSAGVNAQRRYGADVISRIVCCDQNGHEELTALIREQIRNLVSGAAAKVGLKSSDIGYIAVVGNTVMQHLYNGDSPVGIGRVPFTPVSLYGTEGAAGADTGLVPGAREYLAPCVHSYVGGDITAGILASGLDRMDGTWLLIDVGTNGEMALRSSGRMFCCATAAGPAFEGAEISCGMAAVEGAISYVAFDGEKLSFEVIGGGEPKGICGSGLLDALAVMLDTGVVDGSGMLLSEDDVDGPAAQYIDEDDDETVFRLSRDVYVSAGDVRKLQLAKSAIAAGIQTLLAHAGVRSADGLMLAGGFGSYLDPRSAARIGLFPAELLPGVRALGNTAGAGAVMAAASPDAREKMEEIRQECEYVELSTDKTFNEQFVMQMMFEEDMDI